jgi:hypothetical protein
MVSCPKTPAQSPAGIETVAGLAPAAPLRRK